MEQQTPIITKEEQQKLQNLIDRVVRTRHSSSIVFNDNDIVRISPCFNCDEFNVYCSGDDIHEYNKFYVKKKKLYEVVQKSLCCYREMLIKEKQNQYIPDQLEELHNLSEYSEIDCYPGLQIVCLRAANTIERLFTELQEVKEQLAQAKNENAKESETKEYEQEL